MELVEAIRSRRSVRRFKPEPVPREVIVRILDLASWGPSAMNRQDWRLVVIEGEKKREVLDISSKAFDDFRPTLEKSFPDKPGMVEGLRRFFADAGGAPVLILAYGGLFPNGSVDVCSVSLAVQNLLLAAHGEGLGAVWTDGAIFFREREINEVTGIRDRKLVSIIPVGYPDEAPKPPPRKDGRVIWMGS